MGKDNAVIQEEKTSLKMCIFVPSTVMSSWEHVAAVSCSCLTDAIPQRLLAKRDIIAHWYYWTRLLIKILHRCSHSAWLTLLVKISLFFIKLLYKAGCHVYVPEVILCTWTHTVTGCISVPEVTIIWLAYIIVGVHGHIYCSHHRVLGHICVVSQWNC